MICAGMDLVYALESKVKDITKVSPPLCRPGGALLEILGGSVLPGSLNPVPISDQELAFSTPVFRPYL